MLKKIPASFLGSQGNGYGVNLNLVLYPLKKINNNNNKTIVLSHEINIIRKPRSFKSPVSRKINTRSQ